ncbi:hypothetical protein DY000_02030132 [Brassica cretica]|uniref:Uncharacterized protein n=1 Tax=Brassica cretica TaxID=69181 RepID=A0ABQ7DUR0_BRACR|nr:hypothetical protein DY000_02030132 [Brassica cretica]
MLSSGCKAWSGKTEEIKMTILVGAIQDERTQTPEATHDLYMLKMQGNWPYETTIRPVFSLPEDLQVSRPKDLKVSRPDFFLPEDLQVSRPGFFLPEYLQVSRPVFSLPEDLQLSHPEGRPVSRPGFILSEDLQVSRPVFSLPEDLQYQTNLRRSCPLYYPKGYKRSLAHKTFQTTYS